MGSSLPEFDGPPQKATFDGLLWDMDGTIIDSTAAVEKHWQDIGKEIGVDPKVILETSHGRRSMDTLKVLSPERANWEYIKHMEGLLPKLHGKDAVEIPGARTILDQLVAGKFPWAIVTSGTTPLVTGWLGVLNLPVPEHLVVAEDVDKGKPDPTCYLMGKEKLGLTEKDRVLVLEDSPAGIKAGKAAGCQVIGLVTSHRLEQVVAAGADWVVKDLRSVRIVNVSKQGIELEFVNLYKPL